MDYDLHYLHSRCRVDGGWTKSHSFVEPAMVQSLLVAKSFKGATIETNQIRKFVFLTSINRVQCDSFRVKNSFLSGVSCPFCPSCLCSLSCLFCLFCLSFFFLWVKSRLGWSLVFKNRRGLRLNEVILRWPTTCVCTKMKHYHLPVNHSVCDWSRQRATNLCTMRVWDHWKWNYSTDSFQTKSISTVSNNPMFLTNYSIFAVYLSH